jgi:NAD(P)-dependent dehydrogenase (short-subunit alcohol dehydrogenase family)
VTNPDGTMRDKVCLITGSTSGIGRVTALELARLGATVVMVSRDRGRGEATRSDLVARSGNPAIALLVADLGSLAAIRQLAQEFKSRYDRLHVLVNNAGALHTRRTLTIDGLETTFAVNHLAYFLLTNLLLDVLKASAPARIVSVASAVQGNGKIRFDDLQGERNYRAFGAYGQSKLANVMFTYELARRLAGTGVTANCLHPGPVATGFGHNNGPLARLFFRLTRPLMRGPEQGAQTVIYLASAPEVASVSGKYFIDNREARSSDGSYDQAAAQRLWQVSAELTKLPA